MQVSGDQAFAEAFCLSMLVFVGVAWGLDGHVAGVWLVAETHPTRPPPAPSSMLQNRRNTR